MKALLIIDVQNDFLPGGALPVPHGDEVIPVINRLQQSFPLVVATRDWHPENHRSFITDWPVHCVQGERGAQFSSKLETKKIACIFDKGVGVDDEGYSAFEKSGLADYLKKKKVDELYVVGLATDYCVRASVLDALALDLTVFVIMEGCRAIGDSEPVWIQLRQAGATVLTSHRITDECFKS